MSNTAVDTKEINIDSSLQSGNPLDIIRNSETSHTRVMPSIVQPESCEPEKTELVFKLEPGTEIVKIGTSPGSHEPAQFENDVQAAASGLVGREHASYIGEEPLEIQCGENSALLYVSKLCQGSKGPCILFNNEWLTPNELQYISGRETAKDWKRSIRFKGKSLKSLIARGLIKVHPPICDCLGCRISSPVNRGRLASKCGVAPPVSPRSRKRDASKSLSCWTHEELERASSHRHYSTSDLESFQHPSMVNGYKADARPASNSSTASECSDVPDDNPFSPVAKSNGDGGSDEMRVSMAHFMNSTNDDYDKALAVQRMIQQSREQDAEASKEHNDDKTDKTRSAFRSVQQETMTPAVNDNDSKDMAARAAKIKQKTQSTGGTPTSPFLPPYTQYPTGPGMVSPTSPRLVPDHLLFGSPHGTNLYHHAFRGAGFHGVPQMPRNLMQYRLLTPPGTGSTPQSPLAGLSIQSQLQMMQDIAAVQNGGKLYDKKRATEENGIPHKRRRSSNENSDDKSNNSVFSDDDSSYSKKENGHHGDRINHVSVIHRSPVHSPLTIDTSQETKNRSENNRPHRLIPKLRLNTDDSIVHWDVNQVCDFISSLTGSSEIVNEFKEQCIDGQSLILLKEDHLLNKLGVKLGPALKILAHVDKFIERVTTDDHVIDGNDSG